MRDGSLHFRILVALADFPEGKAGYHALMYKVWSHDKYPRAYRHSSNGGPPGVAMIYGRALRELREQGLIMRIRVHMGREENRFGQEDVQMLSGGRKKLREWQNDRL